MTLNKLTLLLLLLIAILPLSSCKNDGAKEDKTEVAPPPPLPGLSNQDLTALYAATDKVDVIFYELPISVNQDDAASAKNSVLYVSPAPATMNPSCKPAGRLSFMSGGAIYKEADVYLGTGCNYFVFMEKNQPVAINTMAESGVEFFSTLIARVQEKTQ